jgi:hypothetical protein
MIKRTQSTGMARQAERISCNQSLTSAWLKSKFHRSAKVKVAIHCAMAALLIIKQGPNFIEVSGFAF